MFKFTKMWKIFVGLVICVYVLEYMGLVSPEAPAAFLWSFIILDLLGRFKDKDADALKAEAAEVEGLTERQKEWRAKLDEMNKHNDEVAQVRIGAMDAEGIESAVILKANGEIEIEGEPPQVLLDAAYGLQDSISKFGVEAVAGEIKRQLEENENERD